MAQLACGTDVTNVLAKGDRLDLRFILLQLCIRGASSEIFVSLLERCADLLLRPLTTLLSAEFYQESSTSLTLA